MRILPILMMLVSVSCQRGYSQTWLDSHENYVNSYYHGTYRTHNMDLSLTPTVPSDVYMLGTIGGPINYGVTNNFDLGACVERELNDGQWLAGGCKDLVYFLRQDLDGNWQKAGHLGAAFMSNAEHGNQSFQLKVGMDLGSMAASLANMVSVTAPSLKSNAAVLPPWVSKMAEAVTLDFAGGYRPFHDSSVNGDWTYGVMATVNVPIATTFEWLVSGM